MFRSALRLLRFKPEDGVRVVARGRLSVYDPRGEYQLVCEHMEPKGLGALQLAYEQLRTRLAAEGLFDDARKRPLPALPRRIGIVTSLDGAALRDIIRVLRRRYPNAHLVIAPARVQGDGAARDIARALRQVARIDGRRRGHRRPRRRIDRGPLGVQRGGRGPGDRRLAGAGHLRGRPRDRRDHRRLRRRPAGADAVGGRRDGRAPQGRVHRPHRRPGADASPRRCAPACSGSTGGCTSCRRGRRSPASRRGSRCATATWRS